MSYNPQNPNGQASMANSQPVVIASDQSAVPVSGSVAIGANSSVNVTQLAGNAIDTNSGVKSAGTQRVVLATDQPQLTNALKVDGSAVTQPVSAASLPLPTGAATSAKQPALGTAGTPSTDVLTVQGATSMTPLKVDASGTTQPISGTVTVQQSTAANLKVDLSGTGANTTAIKVDGSAATQPISGTVTVQQPTATNLKVDLSGTGANTTAIKVDASATTQPVSGTVTANAGTGTFSVNNAQFAGNTTATGNGTTTTGTQRVTIASDSTGQVALASGTTVGLAAGGNTIGNVGINAGTNAIGSVNLAPTTAGGWSVSSQTALTNTATVSGAAGKFAGYMFFNPNAAVAYIQVFDTTGTPTLGTTTPTFVVPIPASAAANLEVTNGIAIANGIKIAATTTATGATLASTALTGFVLYK